MSDAPHLASGRAAEIYARRWLESRGLQFVCANYRCKAGEIDLVMTDSDCVVIIEVRFRRSLSHGGPLGSVTEAKRRRIMRATRHLLYRYPALRQRSLRFDVLALSGTDSVAVTWRKRAFYAH